MPPINRCNNCKTPMNYNGSGVWADMREEYWYCPTCKHKYVFYPRRPRFYEPILYLILDILDHNPRDYVIYRFLGNEFRACARCLGAYITGLICFILFGYLYITDYRFSFWSILITSFILGSFTLIDYATVDIFPIRKGNNIVRLITGAFLGIAGMLYFWLLPTDWWFRMITLFFYMVLALLVAYIAVRKSRSNGKAQVSPGQ